MHEIPPPHYLRAYSTDRPLFHVASLSQGLQDGPSIVWIETEYVKQNPVLREVVRSGFCYKFIAQDPLFGVSEHSKISRVLQITQRAIPGDGVFGNNAPIELYAEALETDGTTRLILEAAAEVSPEPPEVRQLAESLAATGFQLTCEFINILRRSHSQYWLAHPNENSMGWGAIAYYSHPRGKWYSIVLEHGFRSRLLGPDPKGGPPQGRILLGMITATNAHRLQTESADTNYSFADEMVSTALIELGEARFRSAILHAVIALESSSKRILERLIRAKLHGFEKGGTVEAISKELSVVALARLVLAHVAGEEASQGIDWAELQRLYDSRNTIVHKSRKRLPGFEPTKSQILDVMKYVNTLESKVASLIADQGSDQEVEDA